MPPPSSRTARMPEAVHSGRSRWEIRSNSTITSIWAIARWNEFCDLVTDTSKNYWGASYWWGTTTDTIWVQKKSDEVSLEISRPA